MRALVEPIAKGVLEADAVIGTELAVERWTGRATGMVKRPGLVLGMLKRVAVVAELGEELPEIGIGDRETDYDYGHLQGGILGAPGPICSTGPSGRSPQPVCLPRRPLCLASNTDRRPRHLLVDAHWSSSRLRPRIGKPNHHQHQTTAALIQPPRHKISCPQTAATPTGSRPPGPPLCLKPSAKPGPMLISMALRREVMQLNICDFCDTSRHNVGLVRSVPEETTCREPILLGFNPMFAELTDKIVHVAVEAKVNMFYGSSIRGWKFMDAFFFFMNPRPTNDITFLDDLPPEQTMAAGKTAAYVADRVQRLVGATLRFRCTSLTKEAKNMALGVSKIDKNVE